MLSPDSRQVLLEALRPPLGADLDAAVVTTFTLSLQAALVPALAFSSLRLNDETKDPVVILEAIKRIGDRTDVFCQAGCIAVPKAPPDLLAFIEPMIHQVAPPRGGLFHPKLWLLKFKNADESTSHRLLVLSRNLTNDNTWDIIVRLDSSGRAGRSLPENRALSRLLRSLPDSCVNPIEADRRRRILALANEVQRIEWELPPGVRSLTFHQTTDRGSMDWASGETLVISPFVNDEGLATSAPAGGHLVARPEQLEMLSPATLERFKTFVLNPAAGVQAALDQTEADPNSTSGNPSTPVTSGLTPDLHAKVYILEPTTQWKTARVLLGSANATSSAFERNVEFMVELTGHRDTFGIQSVIGEKADLFPYLSPYTPDGGAEQSDADKLQAQVESWLRSVASIPHTVTVLDPAPSLTAGSHDLKVESKDAYASRPGWNIQVGLLTRPGQDQAVASGSALDLRVTDVPTADVTAYLTVSVIASSDVCASTVVVADLVNPPENRLDLVLARQIDTPEKLMRLIHLLLDFANPAALSVFENGEAGPARWTPSSGGSGELELILRALAADPKILDNLDDLITRLQKTEEGRAVLPPDFARLWTQVRQARTLIKDQL